MTRSAVLCGLGGWTPPTVVTNFDLSRELDTSDEWIRSRTGIAQRHVVDPGDGTGDLAVRAGEAALASARLTDDAPAGIDLVLVATTTPDRPCPATAPWVAAELGLTGVAAMDVNAACSGFLYALASASAQIAVGAARGALVIGADAFTTVLDPGDRATRAVFGDAAGAIVLRAGEAGEPGAVGHVDLGSDGQERDLLTVPAGGSRQRSTHRPPAPGDEYFVMDGRTVFVRAVLRMAEASRRVVSDRGLELTDVDHVVGHQANARILAALADELGLPGERVFSNITHVGNTVAASIPLALTDAARRGVLRKGDKTLLTAFGAGTTWGATVLEWPHLEIDPAEEEKS